MRLIGHLHERGLVSISGLHSRISGVVKKREKLVILFLRNWIVFVVVALGTLHSEPHPDICGGLNAICHILNPQFFGKCASLIARCMISIEPRCDLLGNSGLRKKIASDLLNRELIKRHVAVVSLDDPIAPRPHEARPIGMHHTGVAIACGIHPRQSHSLTVSFRSKETIDQFFVSFR